MLESRETCLHEVHIFPFDWWWKKSRGPNDIWKLPLYNQFEYILWQYLSFTFGAGGLLQFLGPYTCPIGGVPNYLSPISLAVLSHKCDPDSKGWQFFTDSINETELAFFLLKKIELLVLCFVIWFWIKNNFNCVKFKLVLGF